MKKLIDWFRLTKKEYCHKYGHNWFMDEFKCYEKGGTMSVADKVVIEQKICLRCGVKLPEKEIYRGSIQKLTMPDHMWDELREKGRVIL